MPGVAKRKGAKLIILNDGETPYDSEADLRFHERIGDVLPPIVEKVKMLSEK
jgi:NAD-dependent SIR2 family protein deacetylase